MGITAEQSAWILHVLGVSIPEAGPTPEAGQGAAGAEVYGAMLTRWRNAEAKLGKDLETLGAAMLSRPEVKNDPRQVAVQKAVKDLPHLLPQFGGALESELDAGLKAADPAEQARHATAAARAIDAYLATLAQAKQLHALEAFSAKFLGAPAGLTTGLSAVLAELKGQLGA